MAQALLDIWLALWPTVFQPALGILMAGAVRFIADLRDVAPEVLCALAAQD